MPAQKSYRAGGTIRRCRFVKLSTTANNTILEADANEVVFGVSQEAGREAPIPSVTADPPEAAQSGDQLNVFQNSEYCLLEIGSGGVTSGGRLKSDADGKGVAIATTGTTIQHIGAIAQATCAAGELCPVQVYRSSERPALS